jgi:hypothetical protein
VSFGVAMVRNRTCYREEEEMRREFVRRVRTFPAYVGRELEVRGSVEGGLSRLEDVMVQFEAFSAHFP